ncbi:hypothetical protein J5N97_024399 [Dioscorea zingiberensis]|uniref:Uncharacterized protein n=1 Tax=Dioscorea zingiberensis TaxID=325984 RepID=A0A9D5C7R1_9LILI|nr:hypothetical protein J5N97_024399 [Dioscorea zingiberensis]
MSPCGGYGGQELLRDRQRSEAWSQLQTIATDFQRIYKIHEKLYIDLSALATDAQTMYQWFVFPHKLNQLREERNVKPETFASLASATLYNKSSSSKIFKAFNALGEIAFSFSNAMLPEIQTPNPPIAAGRGRKTSTSVVLVFHGATQSKNEVTFPNMRYEPMNMLGIIQSQKTAELLLDLKVSSILTSSRIALEWFLKRVLFEVFVAGEISSSR